MLHLDRNPTDKRTQNTKERKKENPTHTHTSQNAVLKVTAAPAFEQFHTAYALDACVIPSVNVHTNGDTSCVSLGAVQQKARSKQT